MKYVASEQSNMVTFYTKDEKFVYENSEANYLVNGVGTREPVGKKNLDFNLNPSTKIIAY